MIYISYDEYMLIGGALDEPAFNAVADRACGIIDTYTMRRVRSMGNIPDAVKCCARDLCDYLSCNTGNVVTSESQSAGGVSESKSYATKTSDEKNAEMFGIVYDYLSNEYDENGTPLMYRGLMR